MSRPSSVEPSDPAEETLARLLEVLDGRPSSPADEALLWACRGRPGAWGSERGLVGTFALPPSSGSREGELQLPGLSSPLRGELARFAAHVLPTWALLETPSAGDERLAGAVGEPMLELFGSPGEGELGAPGRVLTLPLAWLHPRAGEAVAVRPGAEATWRELRDRATQWFRGHLDRAQGRDELASWVLRRMPPVWLVPDRASLTRSGLPGQGPAWIPTEASARPPPRRRATPASAPRRA